MPVNCFNLYVMIWRNGISIPCIGYEITKRYGEEGLPDDTIDMTLHGSGGQSIGAFIPRGETMRIYQSPVRLRSDVIG